MWFYIYIHLFAFLSSEYCMSSNDINELGDISSDMWLFLNGKAICNRAFLSFKYCFFLSHLIKMDSGKGFGSNFKKWQIYPFQTEKKIERTEMSIRAEMIESNARSSQGHVWPTHVNPFDSSFVCCYLSGAKSRISFRNSATAELIIHRTIPPHLKKSAFNNNNSIIWSGRTVILQEIRYSNQNRQDTSVYISDPLEI